MRWIGGLSIAAGLALMIGLAGCGNREAEWRAREARYVAEIDSLKANAQSTRELQDSLRTQIEAWRSSVTCGLSENDIEALKAEGLDDPVVDLVRDLEQHPEIMPFNNPPQPWTFRPVRETILVVSRNWVYAVYEDGHRAGQALLEYTIEEPGRIRWKCLKAEPR